MISEGSMILGNVEHSVIFQGVKIGKGAVVRDSVVMPFTHIGENAVIDHAIVAQNCEIDDNAKVVGSEGAITVVPEGENVTAAVASDKQVG